ncbi:hypothetical protein BDZ91DRAFT_789169 [Kalaharituber pfeilii]|nr:hypothetical protein BDZ91DRAFT_789169 [Kalaharituber pfeilii]
MAVNDTTLATFAFNVPGVHVFAQVRGIENASDKLSIVLELLSTKLLLYIPDIPGYGESFVRYTHIKPAYSKRETGRWILDRLKECLARFSLGPRFRGHLSKKIILIGHDRDARISHRLTFDNDHSNFEIIGAGLLDIVRILYNSNLSPAKGSRLLPLELSDRAIPIAREDDCDVRGRGLGGPEDQKLGWDKRGAVRRWIVKSRHRIRQTEEVESANSIYFSMSYLGSRYDMVEVWNDWIESKTLVRVRGIGNGVGHFMIEEDPDRVAAEIMAWLREVMNIDI